MFVFPAPRNQKCDTDNEACYAVWHIDTNGTRIVVMQGCWPNSDGPPCERDQCINSRAQTSNSIHRFCCCTANMCNVNMTEYTVPAGDGHPIYSVDQNVAATYNETILSALKSVRLWVVVFVISIPLLVSIVYVLVCRDGPKASGKVVHVPSQQNLPKYSADLLNVDNLKLCTMIGRGKYGTVWQGMLNDQSVAVKIFPAQHKDYFLNEKDIYCLPAMVSPHILEYFGCDERRTLDDSIEYLLVLALAPLGCLQEWLAQNVAAFDVFTKMSRSIAAGLSHLHTHQRMSAGQKPCIVHRDLNSRNILVKSDMSCCIADLGFALKTVGPRYEWKGVVTLAEQKSLVEVGTVRYMAPEMLEGAVNLRDCETALKQVDVYSLGLVLWELFTRCPEFYAADEPMPPYRQPYECEVGKMPSLEQMQILVSRQKVRPKFPHAWKRNVSAKVAKDTCEDCWDSDPDARLTALCVEERLREISTYRLQSPTVADLRPELQFQAATAATAAANAIASAPANRAIVECHNEIGTISNGTVSISDDLNYFGHGNGKFGEWSAGSSKSLGSVGTSAGRWTRIRSLLAKTVLRHPKHPDEVSILTDDNRAGTRTGESQPPTSIYQHSTIVDNNRVHMKTKHLPQVRPKHLELALPHINAPESVLLQPDIDSPSAVRNYQSIIKRSPGDFPSQPPAQQPIKELDESDESPCNVSRRPSRIVASKSTNAMRTLPVDCADEWHMKRQRSLEVFRDVFGVKGSVERLRDPSERIKTPGDVPKSVRKVRATKTLSLYDDRMMSISSAGGSV